MVRVVVAGGVEEGDGHQGAGVVEGGCHGAQAHKQEDGKRVDGQARQRQPLEGPLVYPHARGILEPVRVDGVLQAPVGGHLAVVVLVNIGVHGRPVKEGVEWRIKQVVGHEQKGDGGSHS